MKILIMLFLLAFMPTSGHGDEINFVDIFRKLSLPNGLVLDRLSDQNTISVAATGFVSYAKAIAICNGQLKPEIAQEIKSGFYTTINANPSRNEGWLYHFTDAKGTAKWYSEVSSIDTAIFYFSYLNAADLLNDAEFEKDVQDNFKKINVDMMFSDGYFRHGFTWNNDVRQNIGWNWQDTDEGLLLYKLFNKPFKPHLSTEKFPLFVYYYPLCFFDSPEQIELLKQAVQFQKKHYKFIGVTACDGPNGYVIGDSKVFSPISTYAASKFCPVAKEELKRYPVPVLTGSFTENGWISNDFIAIDWASCYIILYR